MRATTPVEIRHVSIKRVPFGGYARSATDRLLLEIADSFEEVWRERVDLADRVEQLEDDVVRYRELEALLRQTLDRTINGEIRTQDAPFVVRSMLMSVYARELTWDFVKRQWDTMDGLYPKHAMRRLAEGVTGLATRELEADVHAFFTAKKPQFGGKVLAQYLEQLRVAVTLRGREGPALSAYLSKLG